MDVLEPPPAHAGRSLAIAALVLLLGAVVPLGLGLAEPREHRAEFECVVSAPRSAVYAALADVSGWRRWNPHVGRARPLGGGRFETRPDNRTRLVYVLEEARPDERVRVSLESTPPKFGATWTFDLSDAGGSTRVRMREDGFVESAALRFVMRYLVGYDVALEGLADALTRSLGRQTPDAGAPPGTSPP